MKTQHASPEAGRRLDLEGLRSVRIRPARRDDVPAIVALHSEALPTAFLPVLGSRFLRILFRAQVADPDAVAFVAERESDIVGYASGVVSMPAFRRRLLVRHALPILLALIPRLLRPQVLRRVAQTATYPEKTKGLPEAEFAFVGVRRRTAPGLGLELGNEVLAALAQRGARDVKGYVAVDNRAMNSMVRRMGFELRAQISLHDGNPSNVYAIRLDPVGVMSPSRDGDSERRRTLDPPSVGATVGSGTSLRPAGPRSSTYVDPVLGTREEAAFLGEGSARVLGFFHEPPAEAVAGVVVCSPIGEEFLRNYRREVLLARSLAAAGIAVHRFHYRGSGSSDGEAEDLTFDTMLEDALAATTLLRERTGVRRLAFLGTRLGALVAAAVAARFPGAPVAMWEPATDGRRYLEEVFRARLVQGLQHSGAEPGPEQGEEGSSDDLSRLRRDGVVDVLGYPISLALYESAVGRRLTVEAGPQPRQVLVAQVGPRQRFRHEYRRLSEEWRGQGWDVETSTFVLPGEAWWFVAPDDTMQPGARMRAQREIIEATRDWLVGSLMEETTP